jgi:two-component system, chemotaxis family, sensor kinase CheA
MDLRRFLDLYVSETQEHVRLLHRSLLELERGETDGRAVSEAFRAAHTLKGLSAAMGYRAVAQFAHLLEDRLDAVRAGRLQPDAALIDAMLADADALEAAIADAVATVPLEPVSDADPLPAASSFAAAPPPAGTVAVGLVRLRADAPIKGARAQLVMRSLGALPGMLGSDPATFDDDFDGEFRIFLDGDADLAAVQATVAAAGDVESVDIIDRVSAGAALHGAHRPPTGRDTAPAAERQIRVDAGAVDGIADGIGELCVLFGRLVTADVAQGQHGDTVSRMARIMAVLQGDVLQLRMVPLREAFDRLPRVVRDAARTLGREVELVVTGDDVQLDRAIMEELSDPLVHLLRNAVDHGIEPPAERERAGKPARGRISITGERERSSVRITISDDGRGVAAARIAGRARAAGLLSGDAGDDLDNEELLHLLSHAGLSTAEQISEMSGRGVGMDVVVSKVRALGGALDMQTTPGQGTTFAMRLPTTLALAEALRVRIGGEDYVIPLTHISEAVALNGNVSADRGSVRLRDMQVPLVRLRALLQVAGSGSEETAIIAERGERRAALAIDELIGREQVVIRGFDPVTGILPYFSGATLMADGRPALVLDPLSMI